MSREHYDAHGDSDWVCGGDDDCDAVDAEPGCMPGLEHAWTHEGCGGCDGVRSLGGTTLSFEARCILCGSRRTEVLYGRQRNPGQCDELRFQAHHEMQDTEEARVEARRQRRNERARQRRRAQRNSLRAIEEQAL